MLRFHINALRACVVVAQCLPRDGSFTENIRASEPGQLPRHGREVVNRESQRRACGVECVAGQHRMR